MIVAGFGFRAAATRASLANALERASKQYRPEVLATVDEKAGAASLTALAAGLGLPILGVPNNALPDHDTPTRSSTSIEAYGAGSIAEAAALAAAGPGARLVAPRSISEDRMATCALAVGGTV